MSRAANTTPTRVDSARSSATSAPLLHAAARMLESRVRCELVAELFVRGLGIAYAIAFASLGVQILGLAGARGIEPAADLLSRVASDAGNSAMLHLPAWFWITGASDEALRFACWFGVVCSLLASAWWYPRIALFGAWSLYLSLCSVCGPFLSFQWDTLLLECGLVGLFVATPRATIGVWLARLLCLKLMLLSGVVKLRSGDPTWRDLTALSFHFWTQPLPTWSAVLANALPAWLLRAMTFACLTIEIVAPLAILGPRRARLLAAAALALLQLMIAATGSYGFFNVLSLLLCASLLDDDALLALSPPRLRPLLERRVNDRAERAIAIRFARPRRALQVGLAALLLALSTCSALQRDLPLPAAVQELLAAAGRFRSINRYGLFAVMTTERHEIALEGSDEGLHWRRYELRWKPDRLDRRPRFATPHMPRLDWQMWFAALSSCERQHWFQALLQRLLEGSPEVLALFETNPFPEAPPRFLRTPLASYHFAPGTAWLHGRWWVSESIGEYCPEVTLRDGKLVRAK